MRRNNPPLEEAFEDPIDMETFVEVFQKLQMRDYDVAPAIIASHGDSAMVKQIDKQSNAEETLSNLRADELEGELALCRGSESLKFAVEYVNPIIQGEKTATIRYDDEKDIEEGDELVLCDPESNPFAVAEVNNINVRTVEDIVADPIEGHEDYEDADDLLETLRVFYDEPEGGFDSYTLLKVIDFETTWTPTAPESEVRKHVVTPCACGCEEFVAEKGQPIRCAECGNIPAEVPPTPVEREDIEIRVVDRGS